MDPAAPAALVGNWEGQTYAKPFSVSEVCKADVMTYELVYETVAKDVMACPGFEWKDFADFRQSWDSFPARGDPDWIAKIRNCQVPCYRAAGQNLCACDIDCGSGGFCDRTGVCR